MRVKFSFDATNNVIEVLDSDYPHEFVNVIDAGDKKIFTVSTPDIYIDEPEISVSGDNE